MFRVFLFGSGGEPRTRCKWRKSWFCVAGWLCVFWPGVYVSSRTAYCCFPPQRVFAFLHHWSRDWSLGTHSGVVDIVGDSELCTELAFEAILTLQTFLMQQNYFEQTWRLLQNCGALSLVLFNWRTRRPVAMVRRLAMGAGWTGPRRNAPRTRNPTYSSSYWRNRPGKKTWCGVQQWDVLKFGCYLQSITERVLVCTWGLVETRSGIKPRALIVLALVVMLRSLLRLLGWWCRRRCVWRGEGLVPFLGRANRPQCELVTRRLVHQLRHESLDGIQVAAAGRAWVARRGHGAGRGAWIGILTDHGVNRTSNSVWLFVLDGCIATTLLRFCILIFVFKSKLLFFSIGIMCVSLLKIRVCWNGRNLLFFKFEWVLTQK